MTTNETVVFMKQREWEIDVTVTGSDKAYSYPADIHVTFTRSDSCNIKPSKVKKALELVSDSESAFSVKISGRGIDVDGYESRYTSLMYYRVERETYRGMELYVMYYSSDNSEHVEPVAYADISEVIKYISTATQLMLSNREHEFRYLPNN